MRRVILAIVSTVAALVLLLSFKTHPATTAVASPPAAVGTTTSGSGTSGSGTASGTSGTKTVTGSSVDTQFGPVQVQVTVTNGKVTAATAVNYPQGNPRDAQINAYAVPALNDEAAQAGNANISIISGATYTSEGYIQSLQSALNKV
jgi:uncharacterized protein with FMN-binding domain